MYSLVAYCPPVRRTIGSTDSITTKGDLQMRYGVPASANGTIDLHGIFGMGRLASGSPTRLHSFLATDRYEQSRLTRSSRREGERRATLHPADLTGEGPRLCCHCNHDLLSTDMIEHTPTELANNRLKSIRAIGHLHRVHVRSRSMPLPDGPASRSPALLYAASFDRFPHIGPWRNPAPRHTIGRKITACATNP